MLLAGYCSSLPSAMPPTNLQLNNLTLLSLSLSLSLAIDKVETECKPYDLSWRLPVTTGHHKMFNNDFLC